MQIKERKNRFTPSSTCFQTTMLLLVFIFGIFGDILWTHFASIINHSDTGVGCLLYRFNLCQGWNFEGGHMAIIAELIVFIVLGISIWFLTKKARKNEEENNIIRDAKLDGLLQGMNALSSSLAQEIAKAYKELRELENNERERKH